jgi:hypothetical protein
MGQHVSSSNETASTLRSFIAIGVLISALVGAPAPAHAAAEVVFLQPDSREAKAIEQAVSRAAGRHYKRSLDVTIALVGMREGWAVVLGDLATGSADADDKVFPFSGRVGAVLRKTARAWEVLAWGLSCDRQACEDTALRAALAKYPQAPASVFGDWDGIREAVRQVAERRHKRSLRVGRTFMKVHAGWAIITSGGLHAVVPQPGERDGTCAWCLELQALLQKRAGAWQVLFWGTSSGVILGGAKKKFPQAPWKVFGPEY